MKDNFDEIRGLVKSFSGLNLEGTLEAQFEDTLRRWLERYSGNSVTLLNVLKTGTENLSAFISEFTINESFFLRNKEHFTAALKHTKKVLTVKQSVNVLSVGCSNGCEPYSLAMVLEQNIPGGLKRVNIHGIDISRKIIEKARRGVYHRWYLRHTDKETQDKFFTVKENLFYLDEKIRSSVKFHAENLYNFEYVQKFDIILCRNFLIYFGDEIKNVLNKLVSLMDVNGRIIFGNSDALMVPSSIFEKNGYLYSLKRVDSLSVNRSEDKLNSELTSTHEVFGVNDLKVRLDYDIKNSTKRASKDESEYFKKGVKYIQSAQYAESIKEFEVIIKNINPNNKRAKVFMAFCFYKLGQMAEYQHLINELIHAEGLFYEAFILNGVVLYESGEHEDSVKNFRKAIFINPDSEIAWFYLGKLYEIFQKNTEALKAYENALKFIKNIDEEYSYPFSPEITTSMLESYIKDRISKLKNI